MVARRFTGRFAAVFFTVFFAAFFFVVFFAVFFAAFFSAPLPRLMSIACAREYCWMSLNWPDLSRTA
ncbi:MAG: hypothetical protein DYH14_16435 [Betaproteobacteria bacterium PRO3]|nr:hypothetical protein [Betaproteobacteria bacterium PRO3]